MEKVIPAKPISKKVRSHVNYFTAQNTKSISLTNNSNIITITIYLCLSVLLLNASLLYLLLHGNIFLDVASVKS